MSDILKVFNHINHIAKEASLSVEKVFTVVRLQKQLEQAEEDERRSSPNDKGTSPSVMIAHERKPDAGIGVQKGIIEAGVSKLIEDVKRTLPQYPDRVCYRLIWDDMQRRLSSNDECSNE